MKFGVRLLGGYLGSTRELVELGVLAEKSGFDFCWFAHDPFMRSAWVTAAVISSITRTIKLGLNFKPYTIDPSEIVSFSASLDEYSGGRTVIGLGTHSDRMFDWLGLGSRRISTIIKEAVDIIRRVLRGEICGYDGVEFKWTRDCYLRFQPIRDRIPIYISGFGRELLELSGEIGDGSLPMLTPPESIDYVLKYIRAGAEKARRQLEEIDIVGLVWMSVSKDGKLAEDVLRSIIAHFGPYLEAEAISYIGLTQDDFEPIKERLQSKDLDGAKKLVTDDMLRLAIFGRPDDCIETLAWLEKKGVTHISIGGPLGPNPKEAIKLIGEKIIPYFRESK